MQNDSFYSISGATGSHNQVLPSFNNIVFVQSCCMFFTKNRQNMAWPCMTIIMSYRISPRSGLYETMILQQNTITKWSNQKYVMYSRGMHSNGIVETIWNCREHFKNNVSKACTLVLFETSWNCREKNENNVSKECILTLFETIGKCRIILKTMSLKHALWRYLKRFGTAENKMKTMSLTHALWRYLKRFGNADFLGETMSL